MKFSLKYKFNLYLCALILFVMAIIYFSTVSREREKIIRLTVTSGETMTKILSMSFTPLIIENDFPGMFAFIEEMTKNPLIEEICITDDKKLCVASSQKNQENKNIDSSILTNVLVKSEPVNFIDKPALRFIQFYHPISWDGKTYGVVSMKYSLKAMREEINNARRQITFILLLALVGGFIVSIFLARIITTPIHKLVKSAKLIAAGDFSHSIPVESSDELGELAQDFNRMTFNISILYNVLKKMNFNTDPDVLLNIIIDNAIMALKAQKASLMLLDDDSGELMVKVVRGIDGKVTNSVKIKPGEGIAGTVFETGEPYISNRGENDPVFKKFEGQAAENKLKNLLCVPLKTGNKVFGVINVSNKENNQPFNEYDLKLLIALTSQAAMTINKAKLYNESITDGMTGLYIHKHFQTRLQDEFIRAKRYNTPLGLIMFDVDHFKSFNDTYGHQQGDIVIKEIAKIVKNNCRKNIDIPARYGGEEFAIISIENTPSQTAAIAERLRRVIEAHEFPGQDNPLHVTISLGISAVTKDVDSKDTLIKMSDTALYFAKRNGRNQSCTFDPAVHKLE